MKFGPIILAFWFAAGCGQNAFQSSETADPAEDATIALENEDPDLAIDILEAELESDPTNYQYISILATAYAQRAGVEPLQFAQNFSSSIASEDEEGGAEAQSSEQNQFTMMFALLPEPTVDNISDINYAVSLLVGIPAEEKLSGDDFKLAMFQTAAVAMSMKSFDADLSGDLTDAELLNMTDAQAAALLAQIDSAQGLLATASDDDKAMQKAAQAVNEFQTDLDSQPGATDEEKLRNYLAANQGEEENAP